ncbi:T9SS type A sorting domain-containing protein [bacterium]|nr:T9SS type A sorting domain-containing protein [bacterium]
MRVLIFIVIAAGGITSGLWGRTLAVPEEYNSIGNAVNAALSGDTILVSAGLYEEALSIPAITLTIRGTQLLDSATTEFAILDPTGLPGSDTMSCAKLYGSSVTFEDFVFRNRWQMTEGRAGSSTGGIAGDTASREVIFRRCVFDSVHVGVARIPRMTFDHCRFVGSKVIAAYTLFTGKVYADGTWFDGATGSLVYSRRGGHIKDCLFTHRGTGYLFLGLGDSLVVDGCRFVGLSPQTGEALIIRPRCGSELRNCVFENLLVGHPVIVIQDSCFNQPKGWECAMKVTNNRFVNCGWGGFPEGQGGEMILVKCSEASTQGYIAYLDSNSVDSVGEVRGSASGFLIETSCTIKNTRFGNILPANKPQIFLNCLGGLDTIYVRGTDFSQDYDGITRGSLDGSVVDARWNWWGHESGPYHPENNPQGQGASVDDGIRFNPWLFSDPDTSTHGDTTESVGPEIDLVPEQFSIRAFPNPFNALTTLEIEVARAGEYEVVLYDVTGRIAANVFRGRIEHSQRLSVDAAGLASGVYFAQLTGQGDASALTKLLYLR